MTSTKREAIKIHCVTMKLIDQIKSVGKTNDKYVITFGIARTERSLSIDDSNIF
jgi:hypothetical protein